MAFRTIRIALLLSTLPIAGCGTVANLAKPGPEGGGKSPFGGVRQDVWRVKQAANGELDSGTHPGSEPEQHPQVARMLLWAADLPFTLIGDVLTWPYVTAYSFINQPTLASPAIQVAAPTPLVTQMSPPATQAPAEGWPPTSTPSTLP